MRFTVKMALAFSLVALARMSLAAESNRVPVGGEGFFDPAVPSPDTCHVDATGINATKADSSAPYVEATIDAGGVIWTAGGKSATFVGRATGSAAHYIVGGDYVGGGNGGNGSDAGKWYASFYDTKNAYVSLTLTPTSIDAGENGTATVKVLNPQDNTSYSITLTSAGPEPTTQPVATLTFPEGDTLVLDKVSPTGYRAVNGRTVGYAKLVATSTNVQTPPATRPARVVGPDLTVSDLIWSDTTSSKTDTNDDPADPSAALPAGPKTLGADADQVGKLKMQLGGHKVNGTYTWSVCERSSGTVARSGTFPAATTAEPSPSAEAQVSPGHQYYVKIERSTPAPVTADAGYNRQINVDVPVVDLQGTDYKSRAVAEAKEEEPGVIVPGSIGVASTGITAPSYPRTLSWDHPDKVTVTEIVNGTATVKTSPVNLAANDAAKQYTIVPTAAMGVDDSAKMTLKVSAADNREFRDEVVVKRNPIDIQLGDVAEDKEESVGAIIAVNDDDDNDDNRMDKDENDGTKTVENEDDLVPLKISVASTIPAGTKVTLAVALNGGGDWKARVKLWQDAKRVTEVVEPLEWTKGTSPIPTIYVEGLAVSVNRDVAFTASCVVAEETYTDLALATVGKADLSTPNVPEQDEQKKGQIICLNNDNDDFGSGSTHNYEPDRAQNNVSGENDLQPVTLALNLNGFTEGQVRFELASGDSKVKVWMLSTKGWGNPLLSEVSKAYNWTVAEFNALPSKTFYVEGYDRSASVKDVMIKVSYRKNASDAKAVLEDKIKWTVVQLMLDADNDGAVTDDTPTFDPGYAGGAPVLTAANHWRQNMQLLVAPVSVGGTTSEIATSAQLTMPEVTSIPGVAMNFGDQSGRDYSFAADSGLAEKEVTASTADKVSQEFYCKDFGGYAVVWVSLRRGTQTLTTCELRLPLDTDREGLPDSWETATANANDPQRSGGQVFDALDPNTKAIGGIPTMAAATWDHETQNPAAVGLPPDGRLGDGLTAMEEYRGFFYGDAANANHGHHRTSPFAKDLFVYSTVVDVDAAATDMGLGYLVGGFANVTGLPTVDPHRINNNEWSGKETRAINRNREGLLGSPTHQAALYIHSNVILGFPDYGVTRPHINTGLNGVCQTAVPNAGTASQLDTQVIEVNRGLANQVALAPGDNDVIDPHVEPGDRIDWLNLRIVSNTPEGKLHTADLPTVGTPAANGYTPDDRIRGNIIGVDGKLTYATVVAVHGDDVLVGEIQEGSDGKLEDSTVANASATDSLAAIAISPGNDGTMESDIHDGRDPAHAGDDVRNAAGAITPGPDGRFQTTKAATDIYRGKIAAGTDGVLQSRPAGASDVVAGTVEEGSVVGLQSSPHGADYIVGYVEDGGNGFLDPTVNNASAIVAGSSGVAAPADDAYDPGSRTVKAGPDGIRNTDPQPGADDRQVIAHAGEGTPFAICVDPDDGNGRDDGLTDDRVDVAAVVDDVPALTGIADVNACGQIYINIAAHDGIITCYRVTVSGPPAFGQLVNVDCRSRGAARPPNADQNRQALLRQTIGHEAGHGCHINHYSVVIARAPAGSPDAYTITPPVGHTVSGSMMTNEPAVVPPSVYDNTDREQVRLHLKHNP